MSQNEKLKINLEIDKRLKELEETGLSREEILTNGKRVNNTSKWKERNTTNLGPILLIS